jgi:rRNA maturation endonuclease Nob1
MGFFNRVGRTVEEFKRTATEVAEEQADYRCRTCESRFHTDHDECPDCGAATVEARPDTE